MSDESTDQLIAETVALYDNVKSSLLRAELNTDVAAEITGGLLAGDHVHLQSLDDGSGAGNREEVISKAVHLFNDIRSSLGNSTHRNKFAATLVRDLLASRQLSLE